MSKTVIARIASSSMLVYSQIDYFRTEPSERSKENLVQNRKTNPANISSATLKRIRNISDIFCTTLMLEYKRQKAISKYRTPRKPVFLTCTLPEAQKHTDQEIRRHILNTFLIYLKRKSNVIHYLQRSEAQQNGNIHFHFILDSFVKKELINKLWADACNVLGYQDKGVSCKIESPRSIDTLSSYISKYVSKKEDENNKRKIEGRVWSCSKQLVDIRHFEIMISYEENFQVAENPEGVALYSRVSGDAAYEYLNDFIEYYRPHKSISSYLSRESKREYLQHYRGIYNRLYG